jgi:hypothetical protein
MVWAKQGVAKPETVREAAIRAAKAIGRMAGSLFTPSIMWERPFRCLLRRLFWNYIEPSLHSRHRVFPNPYATLAIT